MKPDRFWGVMLPIVAVLNGVTFATLIVVHGITAETNGSGLAVILALKAMEYRNELRRSVAHIGGHNADGGGP